MATPPEQVVVPNEKTAAYQAVGALTALGLSKRWHAALLLPTTYDQFDPIYQSYDEAPQEQRVLVQAYIAAPPSTRFGRRAPRTSVPCTDGRGVGFKASMFGDARPLTDQLTVGAWHALLITPRLFDGRRFAELHAVVPEEWVGRMRPVYPGIPGHLDPEAVRQQLLAWLPEAIPRAAALLQHRFAEVYRSLDALMQVIGAPGWSLEQLLLQAHVPDNPRHAAFARKRLLRLATAGAFARAHTHAPQDSGAPCAPIALTTLDQRMISTPFVLTQEQQEACAAMARGLARGTPLRFALVGDVSTGKTITFGCVAAAACDAGACVEIMAPNAPLAAQIHKELTRAFPDLSASLVTGDRTEGDPHTARLRVGTTALLHRPDLPPAQLRIVDEEQKFSVDQKTPQAGAHTVWVSATCIPRTQALAAIGVTELAVLTRGHVNKCITTRLWQTEERNALFGELRAYLRQGEQLLVVYPLRDAEDPEHRHNVARGEQFWSDLYPGKVRAVTGEASDTEKEAALDAIRSGAAQILTATSVAEVGLHLPGLHRVLIINPQRFGLTTLHQIRGRVARMGGEGWCDLFPTEPLTDKAAERLDVLVKHANGFAVAERDLALRGYGDLAASSQQQTGADRSFLFGQPVSPEMLMQLAPRLSPLLRPEIPKAAPKPAHSVESSPVRGVS